MKRLFVLLAGLSLGSAAQAHPRLAPPHAEFCEDLQLSDAQKTQLRDAHLKFADERIDLEAKERHARLDLRKLIGAKDADERAIRKAAQVAADASAKLHQAEELNRVDILLKVFKPDQREQAERCAMMMRFGPHGPYRGPGKFAEERPEPPAEDLALAPPPPDLD